MDTRNDRANRKYNNLFRLENELYHDIAVKMGLSDSAFVSCTGSTIWATAVCSGTCAWRRA